MRCRSQNDAQNQEERRKDHTGTPSNPINEKSCILFSVPLLVAVICRRALSLTEEQHPKDFAYKIRIGKPSCNAIAESALVQVREQWFHVSDNLSVVAITEESQSGDDDCDNRRYFGDLLQCSFLDAVVAIGNPRVDR